MTRPRATTIVLAVACALGLALRVVGLQYGLPHVYNPDEVSIMTRALSFAKGTLNPENFLYPTFFFYVLFAWVGAWLGVLWLSGRVGSLGELQQLYFGDPTTIYTAGRLLGAVAGTATIALVYALGRQIANARIALAAAMFVAVSPLHVRDSHYVKHDVPATLLIVLAYVAMLRVWPGTSGRPATRRDVWIAAAACGAAFSTHYYCVFLAVPLLAVVVAHARTDGPRAVLRECLAAAVISAGVFFALSPYILLEPATVWRDVTANREIVVDRAVEEGAFTPGVRYSEMLLHDTAGIHIVLLAAVGIMMMLRHQTSVAFLLLAFPIPFFLFITNTYPATRYLNPLVPFVAIFGAYGTGCLGAGISRLVPRRGAWRPNATIFWVIAVLAAAPAFVQSARTDLFMRQEDTRTTALRLLAQTVPPGSGVALQPYSAPLAPTRDSLAAALQRHGHPADNPDALPAKFRLQLSQNPWPSPAYRVVYLGRGLDPEKTYVDYAELGGNGALHALRREHVAYVVIKRYNRSDPETLPFLAALAREGRRLAVVSPYRDGTPEADRAAIEPFLHNTDARMHPALERPGPALEIWQIDGPRQ